MISDGVLQPVFAEEGYAGHASLFGHCAAAPRVARTHLLRMISDGVLPPVFAQEGYAGHSSLFGHCAAAPRVARRAKRGGARRDRTADLVIANAAPSQLRH